MTEQALDFDTMLAHAERESGAYGLADAGLRGRIAAMLDWINGRGPYTPEQIDGMRRQLHRLLVTRLRLAGDRKRYPGIAEVKIERPIFVIGFARSGTTLLHSLLAEDPEVLAPKAWHMHVPSPPPGAGPVCAGRLALAQRAVERWLDYCPTQLVMHPYADQGAQQLIENEEVFSLDFWNAYPTLYYKMPTLDVRVILGEDGGVGAHRFHRELLQHLQWNTGKTRWACKGPSAQHHLSALFDAYPDALCVWTHRPLGEIYASNVAIRAATYDTINGRPNDWSSQARAQAEGLKAAIDGLMANAQIDDPRILHLPFRELSADPIGAVRKIYDRAGQTMTGDYEARLRVWLANPENQIDRYGRYPYAYEPLGLDKAWIEGLFADYSRRFGLDARRPTVEAA